MHPKQFWLPAQGVSVFRLTSPYIGPPSRPSLAHRRQAPTELPTSQNGRTPLLLARVELKRSDSGAPVEATASLVVLLRVPESAVIVRINRHTTVIAPPFE